MFYEYRCDDCGLGYELQAFTRIGGVCSAQSCECGGDLIRHVSLFNCTPTQEPYFNHTVGSVVNSTKDFEHKLQEGSKHMSERLGYDQKYTPVYPSEGRAKVEREANTYSRHGSSFEKALRDYHNPDAKQISYF